MIVIPPRHYIVVKNPVVRNSRDEVVYDEYGQALLKWGDEEVRLEREPFPLYPGEVWDKQIKPLEVVPSNTALRLRALRDFNDKFTGEKHEAGEEWWFTGPGTFIPQVELVQVTIVKATVLQPGDALRLRATTNFTDVTGTQRFAGSEWLYQQPGAYLPAIQEEIVGVVKPTILTDEKALHVCAVHHFTDRFGVERFPGDEWLVTKAEEEAHLPHVFSKVVGEVSITTLTKRQYAVIINPVDVQTKRPRFGYKEIRRGECSFFLNPGELTEGIKNIHVLMLGQALLVQAVKPFNDDSNGKLVKRVPGEKWLVEGPTEYLPPQQVHVLSQERGYMLGGFVLYRLDGLVGIISLLPILFLVLWRFF
eukprot:TRINITY_DN12717_c0_g1_i7.p1 TRINITY_DN12717_c0_g1~~TRINITY_DN12717_c0_g1_i7.p1  ORF type:complete len:393 (-),score=106.64 TRINITY_DN12717_c0_g1_i7:183-1274(-)